MSCGSQDIPPTSTSGQQDSISQNKPDSPIMVIDHEDLALARIYTVIGAKCDPFANIAIHYDVAQAVAAQFNDTKAEENPQDSDFLSIEPVSTHPPSATVKSSSTGLTPPTSQTDGSSQSGKSADKPDEVLAAATKCVEPKDVPFSTMTGDRVPLFRWAKVVKKSSREAAVPTALGVPPTTVEAPAVAPGKRPAPSEARPPYSQKGTSQLSQDATLRDVGLD
ncbi:hypothetical protein LIER_12402 [Lithospermum erythrorhizon]|uniref:Uncharacterized protein n=1 Tax=Lithospermum erythrorhizon TaxID=34254 RepID=A0AAV3PW06_LITER